MEILKGFLHFLWGYHWVC